MRRKKRAAKTTEPQWPLQPAHCRHPGDQIYMSTGGIYYRCRLCGTEFAGNQLDWRIAGVSR